LHIDNQLHISCFAKPIFYYYFSHMKYLTITLIFLVSTTFACKKKTDTYCYYEAMKGSASIYTWVVFKPTNDQIKKVQDSCTCTVTIKESCVSCNGRVTDASGNTIACD